MNSAAKLAGFAATLGVVFVAAVLIGRALGPVDAAEPTHAPDQDDRIVVSPVDGAAASQQVPGGLMSSQGGYSLVLAESTSRPGADIPVSLTITGPDGEPVTEYDVEHEKELHLIAVRRDFTGFQHVHPTRDGAGVWTTELDLAPGTWRLFADFHATGADALTLGADLAVGGDYRPTVSSDDSRTATVDGYQVTLAGDLVEGSDAELTLTVSKDGAPVDDLQPYLGAYGHLVALRTGDLAYLHVHPEGSPGDGTTPSGPDVVFRAAVPSGGTYHLYLDFQHEGTVRTAAFTVDATERAGQPAADGSEPAEHSDGGHSGH